jgi:hypothetical protein
MGKLRLSDICLPAPAPFGVKKAAFWGMGARKRAHTPKCGSLPRGALTVRLSLTVSKGEFLKSPFCNTQHFTKVGRISGFWWAYARYTRQKSDSLQNIRDQSVLWSSLPLEMAFLFIFGCLLGVILCRILMARMGHF